MLLQAPNFAAQLVDLVERPLSAGDDGPDALVRAVLQAGELLDESALDKYVFRRDAFLQKRRNDIYDGFPPPDDEEPPEPENTGARP